MCFRTVRYQHTDVHNRNKCNIAEEPPIGNILPIAKYNYFNNYDSVPTELLNQ